MKNVLAIGVLVLALSFLSVQAFTFWSREGQLANELAEAQEKLKKAEGTRDNLEAQLVGYDDPESIERTVREQFNYRRPDEKMLIIIPPRESATSTSN